MIADRSTLLSKSIDWLRFPMAFAVVMIHHGGRLIAGAAGPLKFLCVLFGEGICRLAVPYFFLISGFLFFNNLHTWDWTTWKSKIRRRVQTLLIPYVLWIIITFLFNWAYASFQHPVDFHQFFQSVGGIRMFWGVNGDIPIGVRSMPINSPLWFIRDLMLFSLLTPLIYLFLRWTRGYGVLVICGIFLFKPGIVPEGAVFFLVGAWMQMYRNDFAEGLLSRRFFYYVLSLIFLALVCVFFDQEYWRRLFKTCFQFVGMAAMFCMTYQGLKQGRLRVRPFLVGSCFFILAAHVLVLHPFAAKVVGYILPAGMFWDCLEYFLSPALAVAMCLGLYCLIQRWMPRIAMLLTGNRQAGLS